MATKNSYIVQDPKLIERNGQPIAPLQSTTMADQTNTVLDNTWAKRAFLINDTELNEESYDAKNRYWSSASSKFTDTRLGGSIGVNARPSFTRYSDIRVKGRIKDRNKVSLANVGGNYGEGRYYSEAISDNAQTIYIRAGVPQFNSLTNFFSKAFDPDMMSLAKSGRGLSTWYRVGQVAGTIVGVAAFPALAATILAFKLINSFFTKPTSKFYSLKPTMHTYWSTVNYLANTMAINMGILPRVMMEENADQTIGSPYKLDQGYLDNLHKLMPDVFTDSNGFNVFAIANRAQRIANKLHNDDYEALNKGSATDFIGYVQKNNTSKVEHPKGEHSLSNFIDRYLQMDYYTRDKDSKQRMEVSPKINEETGAEEATKADGFAAFFDAEYRDGAQFAVFKVDSTGSVGESFANTAVESDLASKFNSMSSTAREAKFSFAEGNLSDDAISTAIGGAIGAVTDVVKGVADGVTGGMFSSLVGLTGEGFLDIQRHYQNSNASLPHTTYNMQLISPYNNPISRMQNIFIPLAMLMALALPRSTGKQSYTSPFLVQLFDRGRCQVQTGMVTSFTVSRGTCNLPFTNRGQVLAIDVSITIEDLSSIMHMPVSTGSLFGANTATDEDNILMDYLAVLAGQDIYSQIYALPKAKLNLAKRLNQMSNFTNPAYWASLTHQETTTGSLSWLGVGNLISAVAPASNIITQ